MIPCSGEHAKLGQRKRTTILEKAGLFKHGSVHAGASQMKTLTMPIPVLFFEGKPEWCGRSVGFVNGQKTDCCEAPQEPQEHLKVSCLPDS